jgi:uncharacterized membrane protein (UPF0182 family)
MEESLDAALRRIFPPGSGARLQGGLAGEAQGEAAPAPVPAAPTTIGARAAPGATADVAEVASEARAAYQSALEAQRAGDWAKYGEEIRRLGALLERMNAGKEKP